MISQLAVFRLLAGEALRDAVRRRIVLAVGLLSIASLLMIDGCSGLIAERAASPGPFELERFAAVVAVLMLTSLCLWLPVLGGLLATEPLSRSLAEGTASLWLSRPVSRESFVLAQLAGALAVALAAGAVLLAGAGALLYLRQGLGPGPVMLAGAAGALNALTVASLAMLASLRLPRAAVSLLVVGGIAAIAGLELAQLGHISLSKAAAVIAEYGPPLVTAPLRLGAPWVPDTTVEALGPTLVRAVLWPVGAVALLCLSFRRLEIERR